MLDRIDAFIRDLAGARTEDDLDGLLAEISREMGFTYFAVTHHVDLHGLAAPAIRLANYPADWVDYFDRNGLGPCDPVHRASQLTSVGFPWSRLPELIRLSARDREVLDLAARRGIGGLLSNLNAEALRIWSQALRRRFTSPAVRDVGGSGRPRFK